MRQQLIADLAGESVATGRVLTVGDDEVDAVVGDDGLESQTLTFDACDVQLRGDAAIATCRGSARYVPKIGSREPRVEPRFWNFSLRKTMSGDWTIDSARAER